MTTTRTRTTHYVVGDDGREWPVQVCVETFTSDGSPVTDDACWGYLGVDHAEAELRAALR